MSYEAPGTRFLLFPQSPFLSNVGEPELIEVSSPPGTIGPGPSNDRMYTVYPVSKPVPYGLHQTQRGDPFMFLPPWKGEVLPPALPDENGHFDYITPDDPSFEAAHLFAAAHFTLDVWEGYFGRPIPWHFRNDYDRLELTMLPSLDNALIGWGFLETGGTTKYGDEYRPYSLNFDVVAHEIGHAIIYSEVGIPTPEKASGEYYGFHESAADLVALLSTLHLGSVVEDLLESTRGNLYALNKLNRFAELSDNDQIRLAANTNVLSEFVHGWSDEHLLAQPLTGAMFDIFVDVFHERLLLRDLISTGMEDLSDRLEADPSYGEVMQGMFDERYAEDPDGFRIALLEARDYLGSYLADAWQLLNPEFLTYYGVEQALLEVDHSITGGQFEPIISGNFRVRDIGLVRPGPRLKKPGRGSHSASVRTLVP